MLNQQQIANKELGIVLPITAGSTLKKRKCKSQSLERITKLLIANGPDLFWDKSKVSQFLNCKRRMSLVEFVALCDAMNVAPDELLHEILRDSYPSSTAIGGLVGPLIDHFETVIANAKQEVTTSEP